MRVNPNSLLAVLVGFTLNLGLSGTAQAALQGRDLNGSTSSAEAYYDTDLNITWLSNPIVNVGAIAMPWVVANTWAADLSIVDTVNNTIYDNWRLPTVNFTSPVNVGIWIDESASLIGFNVDTSRSEMAHLFFDELGNKAYGDTNGIGPQPGWGLSNSGDFINLQPDGYWTNVEIYHNVNCWGNGECAYISSDVFAFDFGYGYQSMAHTGLRDFYALAVSDGDVGVVAVPALAVPDVPAPPVPEADTWAMLLAGLGLVGFMAKRRKQVEA